MESEEYVSPKKPVFSALFHMAVDGSRQNQAGIIGEAVLCTILVCGHQLADRDNRAPATFTLWTIVWIGFLQSMGSL